MTLKVSPKCYKVSTESYKSELNEALFWSYPAYVLVKSWGNVQRNLPETVS